MQTVVSVSLLAFLDLLLQSAVKNGIRGLYEIQVSRATRIVRNRCRSEEHTSELQSLHLHKPLPISSRFWHFWTCCYRVRSRMALGGFMKYRLVALLALSVTAALFAQEFRGTISGLVTDATGSTVPGAKVTVTETQTGTRIPTVSDNSGQYTAAFLLPGEYEINVQSAGFKAAIRKGVHLGAGDHPVIDVTLDVGDIATSVEVVGDASMLNTESASLDRK